LAQEIDMQDNSRVKIRMVGMTYWTVSALWRTHRIQRGATNDVYIRAEYCKCLETTRTASASYVLMPSDSRIVFALLPVCGGRKKFYRISKLLHPTWDMRS